MDVVERFEQLLTAPAPPLDEALALIAANGRSDVDPGQVLDRLDVLAAAQDADGARSLTAALFAPGAFEGNLTDYYDPANSLLDLVLERRIGIPITLAVVAIEVGRRRDIALSGVGMPGHFLLRSAEQPADFFDPFDRGLLLDARGCQALFERLHGSALEFEERHLQSTPNIMIVARVLNNLQGALMRRGDRRALADVLRLQAALPGAGVEARLRLAGVLSADGRFTDAARVHDRLAVDDAEHADDHRTASARLRAKLN